jgi:hypothetical protein
MVSMLDDGAFVSLQVRMPKLDDALTQAIQRIAADVRVLEEDGECVLDVRFHRDGRCATAPISPGTEWPGGDSPITVDFDDSSGCSPSRMEQLLDLAAEASDRSREVRFLNVPSWLRLHVEILGRAHAMPNRGLAGPRLPEVLSELWR